MKKVYGKRAMLNKPGHHGVAAIVAEVEDTSKKKYKKGDYIPRLECCIEISDCSRVISLEFGFDSKEDRENNLYKIDTIIDTLSKFKKGLIIEQELYAKRIKKYKTK